MLSAMSVLPGCPDKCGDITVQYPFGLKDGCYYPDNSHNLFFVPCNQTSNKPIYGKNVPVLGIFPANATLRVLARVSSECYPTNSSNNGDWLERTNITIKFSRFRISGTRNKFTGVGCDTAAFIVDNTQSTSLGCLSTCRRSSEKFVREDGLCNGGGCCRISELPKKMQNITIFVRGYAFGDHPPNSGPNPCSYAYLAENEFSITEPLSPDSMVPMVLDWAMGNGTNCTQARMKSSSFACKENSDCSDVVALHGYVCSCSSGFHGNPYIGCQDIDECGQPEQYRCNGTCHNSQGSWSCIPRDTTKKKRFIIMIVAIGTCIAIVAIAIQSYVVYRNMKKKRQNNQKTAYFRRNGGLMLQDNLSQVEYAHNAFKLFTAEEMESATNKFDKARIVGSGGFADVYKGELSDGTLVAVKKPKTKSLEDSEDVEFINEVVLLAKIQHHNVVTFLGCCLETEAPLLVYEFIANGTLLDHLRKLGSNRMPWETRLKIAAETAGVVSYLHHDHRPSIIHSDIKPHNILLGDDFTAKVSDFGISKQTPQNEMELYTKVKGTLGYLDPEFMQSGQLTEKSDVYSFGVVLLELLTGQTVLNFDRNKSDWCLVNYFQSAYSSDSFSQILDTYIVSEQNMKQLREVSEIAIQCVSFKSEERPSMKLVAMELGGMVMEERGGSSLNSSNLIQATTAATTFFFCKTKNQL